MKNLPDPEMSTIDERLQHYSEEPGDELWDRIAEDLQRHRAPLWFVWIDRITGGFILLALLWLMIDTPAANTPSASEINTRVAASISGHGMPSVASDDRKRMDEDTSEAALHKANELDDEKRSSSITDGQTRNATDPKTEHQHEVQKSSAENDRQGPRKNNRPATASIASPEKITRANVERNDSPSSDAVKTDERTFTAKGERSTMEKSEASGLSLSANEKTIAAMNTMDTTSTNEVIVKKEKRDSLVAKQEVAVKAVVPGKREEESEKKKRKPLVMYASMAPSMNYLKFVPLANDGVVISGIRSSSVLSSGRMGLSLEAGLQGMISRRVEFFSGISLYRQKQQIAYLYQTDNSNQVVDQGDMTYQITPTLSEGHMQYSMLNVGLRAGLMYQLSIERLAHKAGVAISGQSGMLRSSEDAAYSNARSRYLFYELFYRNEYAVNGKTKIFVQPFFTHSFFVREELRAPFHLRPYRAGISFGLVYRF